jgi:hypothetical protein
MKRRRRKRRRMRKRSVGNLKTTKMLMTRRKIDREKVTNLMTRARGRLGREWMLELFDCLQRSEISELVGLHHPLRFEDILLFFL